MECSYCDVEMEKRHATHEHPYVYEHGGLNAVLLSGIDVYRCPNCEIESPVIPGVAKLHESLASEIVNQPGPLRGDEIRFLRKYAALPAQKFARLIGVRPEHLSRVENGHTKSFGKNTDRLIRAFTLTAKKGREARLMLLRMADQLEEPAANKPSKFVDISYALKPRVGWQRTG